MVWHQQQRDENRTGRRAVPSSTVDRRAFTLIELMVVISIIGILLYLALPAIKDMTRSDAMAAANRQLLDDVARARRLAINNRSTVYMVFMSSNVLNNSYAGSEKAQVGRFLDAQYNGHALFTRRRAGEQPGRENPQYLSEWKRLPKNIMIAPWKYTPGTNSMTFSYIKIPFPLATSAEVDMPYIAFDYQGRLVHFDANGKPLAVEYDEVIPLARGSLMIPEDLTAKTNLFQPPDILENPPNNSVINSNHVRIDCFTGRAKVQKPEIQ